MTNKFILLSGLFFSLNAMAFDNDYSINLPNFNTENFLDITYVQFNETLDQQWYGSDNGLRITGHSLTSDLLYINTEFKLKNTLSDRVNVRVHFQQEDFYAKKQTPPLQLEVETRLFANYPLSASLLGTAEYKKADSDLGVALTLGRQTSSFIRLADISVDYFYNQKNDSQSSYLQNQHLRIIQFAYQWSSWQTRFNISDASPMHFLYNDQLTLFTHQGFEYDGFISYKANSNNSYKISLNGFETDKSISGTINKQQTLKYDAIDIKWLWHQQHAYAYTFGLREDVFTNHIVNSNDASLVLDYPFSTRQIYSSVYHAYTNQKAWELGLYLGISKEPNDFYNIAADNSRVYESKLSSSWIYHAENKKSSIFLHISWNLDGTIQNPADGGGITYQSTF
ncbi:MAG: hypothetical protein OEY11_07340 [Gammaproteobacteria bacterium]|nr:hypothetical protein [Gammaproteobacteria bacterium]